MTSVLPTDQGIVRPPPASPMVTLTDPATRRYVFASALGCRVWLVQMSARGHLRRRMRQTSRVIVFTGHRIDRPDREAVRFAADRVEAVRAAMRAWLLDEKHRPGGPLEGIAGGAAGSDILFHEVCAEPDVEIPTRLLLALPIEAYVADSVQYAGTAWTERFWEICRRLTPVVLGEEEQLPRLLGDGAAATVWSRNNEWLLETALARGDAEITLLLLWDGRAGDGPGGTSGMIRLAQQWAHRRLRIVRLDLLTLEATLRGNGEETTMELETGGIPLAEMIQTLRRELETARQRTKGEEIVFQMEKVELELEVALTRTKKAEGGVEFWVVKAGGEIEKSGATTHTFKITLTPMGVGGEKLKVSEKDREGLSRK